MNRGGRELYVPDGVAPYIALERQGDCLVVTFNRPEKHNAFPDEAHDDLRSSSPHWPMTRRG